MPSRRGRPEWFQPKTKPDKHLLESYARGQNPGLATDEELDEVQDRLTRARNENTSAEQPWRSTVHLGSTRDLRGYWEPEKIDHWRKLGGQSEPYEMSCMSPHNHPTTQLPHGMQSGEPRSGSTTVGTRPNELDAYPRAEMEGDLYHPRQELNELDTPDEEVCRGRSQHWTPKAT